MTTIGCSKDKLVDYYDIYSIPYYTPILESMNMPRPEGSYTYPIIPTTKEWSELSDREEKETVCQVPFDVLSQQTTQAVIQGLWEYPLNLDFFAWNNYQERYDFVYLRLNAYRELLKRPDAALCLLEKYKIVAERQKGYPFSHYILEMHLAQEYFIMQLSADERKNVVKRSLEIIRIIEQDIDFFDVRLKISISLYLIGRIMRYDNYSPFMDTLLIHPEWKSFFEHNDNDVITDEKLNTFSDAITSSANDYVN